MFRLGGWVGGGSTPMIHVTCFYNGTLVEMCCQSHPMYRCEIFHNNLIIVFN